MRYLSFLVLLILNLDVTISSDKATHQVAPLNQSFHLETARTTLLRWNEGVDLPFWSAIEDIQKNSDSYHITFNNPYRNETQSQRDAIECLSDKEFGSQSFCFPANIAIRSKDKNILIGWIQLSELDEDGLSEFMWSLSPEVRGKGVGREVFNNFIGFIDRIVNMPVINITMDYPEIGVYAESYERRVFKGILADVDIQNPASLKVLSRFMKPIELSHNIIPMRIKKQSPCFIDMRLVYSSGEEVDGQLEKFISQLTDSDIKLRASAFKLCLKFLEITEGTNFIKACLIFPFYSCRFVNKYINNK